MSKKINKKPLQEIAADSRYRIFENWNNYLSGAPTKSTTTLIEQQEEMPQRFAGMSTKYLIKKGYEWRNGSMVHKTKGDVRDVLAAYNARRAGKAPPARKYGAPGSHFADTQPGAAAAAAVPEPPKDVAPTKSYSPEAASEQYGAIAAKIYDALEGAGTDSRVIYDALDNISHSSFEVYKLYRVFDMELKRRGDTERGDLITWLLDDGEKKLARWVHKKANAGARHHGSGAHLGPRPDLN